MQEFWPFLLSNIASVHCSFVDIYESSSLKVPSQCFCQVEVWLLHRSSQQLQCFCLQPFCGKLLSVAHSRFCKFVIGNYLEYFVHRGVHGRFSYCKVLKSYGHKNGPNHHPCITVLDDGYEMFVLTCCGWFMPSMMQRIIETYLHFSLLCPKNIVPEALWFVESCVSLFFFERVGSFGKKLSNKCCICLFVLSWTLTFGRLSEACGVWNVAVGFFSAEHCAVCPWDKPTGIWTPRSIVRILGWFFILFIYLFFNV